MRLLPVLSLLAASWLASGANASANQDVYQEARACLIAGDFTCGFELLIDLAEAGELPVEMGDGLQTIAGAMLEASLAGGFGVWTAEETFEAASRYVAFLEGQTLRGGCCGATGYFALAMACQRTQRTGCFESSVRYLCDNEERLFMPMGGRPAYEEMRRQLITLVTEECEA